MSLVLATIVAGGFVRTFYLRPAFLATLTNPEPLPVYLNVHGVLLTAWFSLLIVQSFLVASKRTRLHRTLGVYGAFVALGVLAASLLVVIRSIARSEAGGIPADRLPVVVVGNLGSLILFAVLIGGAIAFRRKPDVHKRLMVIGSIGIVAPAIARWPGALTMFPVFVLAPQLALLLSLIVYDLVSRRRVHAATAWGELTYLVIFASSVAIGFNAFGNTIVNALR